MIRTIYNTVVRPALPRKVGMFNGVGIRNIKILDSQECFPGKEKPLIETHYLHTRPGDDVVIVGGGFGVSTATAARRVAPQGSVTVYEPSVPRTARLRETIELNSLPVDVEVINAAVGPESEVEGIASGKSLAPDELPDCDILEIDCEGAELDILRSISIRPRHIYCEFHECFGAPRSAVDEVLTDAGYETEFVGWEKEDRGVGILAGKCPQ